MMVECQKRDQLWWCQEYINNGEQIEGEKCFA